VPFRSPASSLSLERLRFPWGRRAAVLGSLAVVAAIIGLNLALHLVPGPGLGLSVAAAAVLLRSGALWGGAVVLLVGTAYLVAVLLPSTRTAFLDERYRFGVSEALLTAFIVIPLGTILLEEVAFRSVLWGMLSRHMGTWRVLLVSSSLFGLWHVFPSLSFASANQAFSDIVPTSGVATTVLAVVGTVLFTGLGGVVAGELRRRSGSVLASAGMHWATNSLGVLFGLVAWRLVA